MSDYEGEDWDPVDPPRDELSTHQQDSATKRVPVTILAQGIGAESSLKKDVNRSNRRICVDTDPHHETIQVPQRSTDAVITRGVDYPIPKAESAVLDPMQHGGYSPQTPDHKYVMSTNWGGILKQLSDSKHIALMMARRQLGNICALTKASVLSPVDNTNILSICGTHEQIGLAIAQLDLWLTGLQLKKKENRETIWQKNNAYDGRREHRNMQDSYEEYTKQIFKNTEDIEFCFEAYLLWPADYDLDAYLKHFESTAMDTIATNFGCHFHHEKKGQPRYTRIRAQSEQDLLAAYQRLIGMVREMTSRKNYGVHGNFALMPHREDYRERVVIRKDPSGRNFSFAMTGDPPVMLSEDDWTKVVHQMEISVRGDIANTLVNFMQNLYISQAHVRLRVDFGHLDLKSFQKPQDGSHTYQTEAFLEMIRNPRTELSRCELRANYGGDMFRLIGILKGMPEFYQLEETFRVMFDFQSPIMSSRARLEVERDRGYDIGETQIRAQRWFELSYDMKEATALCLKVLDLVKPSFTIRANCWKLMSESHITRDMRVFQNSQNFVPDSDAFQAFPKKRSIITPGQKDLTTVTEITSMKMRIREMDGIFELQREDIFDHRGGKDSPFPISSQWSASYYYLGWDSLLDDYANIQSGEDVAWTKSLSTFFPEQRTENDAMMFPSGFKKLWEEIKLIQGYLDEALSQLGTPQRDVLT